MRVVAAVVAVAVVVAVVAALTVTRTSDRASRDRGPPGTVRVPEDAPTIQAGVDEAAPGDVVSISPGVYRESVSVETAGLVIRGKDRHRTILDGGSEHPHGIEVRADGVTVEHLTARDYAGTAFAWIGVTRYRGSNLTAIRNEGYGIYALTSRRGRFEHSFASGNAGAGFYVGQCFPCDAVVTDVVAEDNYLGFSASNAGGELVVTESVWRTNRAGIVVDQGAAGPLRGTRITGNVVRANNNRDAPTVDYAADVFDATFGTGIAVIGGGGHVIARNRVADHEAIGVALLPNPGADPSVLLPRDIRVAANIVVRSGRADLGLIAASDDDPSCFARNTYATSIPADVEQLGRCAAAG